MRVACRITKALQTHAQNMLCLLHFIGSSGYANAPNRSGIRNCLSCSFCRTNIQLCLPHGLCPCESVCFSHVCSMPHQTRPFSLDKPNNILLAESTSLYNFASYSLLLSSTCFEPQVLIFRRIQLYTCRIWYCHSV